MQEYPDDLYPAGSKFIGKSKGKRGQDVYLFQKCENFYIGMPAFMLSQYSPNGQPNLTFLWKADIERFYNMYKKNPGDTSACWEYFYNLVFGPQIDTTKCCCGGLKAGYKSRILHQNYCDYMKEN